MVSLRVRGDEHFNWTEDTAGYTVIHQKGWYKYARLNPQGRLVPTGLKVGLNNTRHGPGIGGGIKRCMVLESFSLFPVVLLEQSQHHAVVPFTMYPPPIAKQAFPRKAEFFQ